VRADAAECEHTVGLLRQHLLADRLSLEEFADRVLAAYSADTHEELDALIADLPPIGERAARRRVRGRHGEADLPAVGWRPTAERFRDPTTDRVMRVWVEPATGDRHYVAE
jgi:uncharacterized protein DUF1707